MQEMSAAWRAALPGGLQISNLTKILQNGSPVATLGITDGTVTVDRNAAARRGISLVCSMTEGTLYIPTPQNSGLLTPFGNEIAPQGGWINPATGIAEMVPMGVFALETVIVNDTGSDLSLSLTGYDRSWVMSIRKFQAPYPITVGTRGDAAMSALVGFVLGSTIPQNIVPAIDGSGSPLLLPALTFNEGTDPWQAMLTIAGAIGYNAYFDVAGTFTAAPIPNPQNAPISWQMIEGQGNIAEGYSRALTRQGVSNDFTVTGSGTSVNPPVRGQAQVTDSTSPMWIGGDFGDVPTFTDSSAVTSSDQAQFAAQNQLAAAQGQIETLTMTTYALPAADVDDVYYCERLRAGIQGTYVVDTAVTSFSPAAVSTFTMRRVA